MCSVTYPALVLAYTGQASFLRKNNDLVSDTFYKSIPRTSVLPLKTKSIINPVCSKMITTKQLINGAFISCRSFILANVYCCCYGIHYSFSSHDLRDFLHHPTIPLTWMFSSRENSSYISQVRRTSLHPRNQFHSYDCMCCSHSRIQKHNKNWQCLW